MIKTALVIVPHPDDEINLAGGLFQKMRKQNIQVSVLFCTNGDYDPKFAAQRYQEIIKAKKILGYDNIILLGYSDGFPDIQLYDLKIGETAISKSALTETTSYGPIQEYCFIKDGVHHKFTRANFKDDLKCVITEMSPDLIICNDNDCHFDHRNVSMFFDECMAEILRDNDQYRPIVLKGFAYMGTWAGINDFFFTELQPLYPSLDGVNIDERAVYPYRWDKRLRLKNDESSNLITFWNNTIYRAICAHKSQRRYPSVNDNAYVKFPCIANPESCYWRRSSNNLILKSTITATSGDTRYLNDYKLVEPISIKDKDYFENNYGWEPSIEDCKKQISIDFDEAKEIKVLRLYLGKGVVINKIEVVIDNSLPQIYENLEEDYPVIDIPISSIVSSIAIRILSYTGQKLSINEIECLDSHDLDFHQLFPIEMYIEENVRRPFLQTKILCLLFNLLSFILIFNNKIQMFSKLVLGSSDTKIISLKNIILKFKKELMGLAIILIMGYHSHLGETFNSIRPMFFLKELCDVGVEIFLLLSGFSLAYSLNIDSNLIHFYKKRISRLLPPYIIIFGLWYIFYCIRFGEGFSVYLWKLFFLDYYIDNNLSAWFVPVILLFYLITPLYVWCLKRYRVFRFVPYFIILTNFYMLYQGVDPTFTLLRMPIFLLGINLYYSDNIENKKTNQLRLSVLIFCLLVSLVISYYCMFIDTSLYSYKYIIYPPIAVSLILISRVFTNVKLLGILGGLTLEIYLLHEQIETCFIFVQSRWLQQVPYLVVAIMSVVVTIYVAKLLKKIIAKLHFINN